MPYVAAILLVHGVLVAWIAAANAPVMDEVAHLPAGLAHWKSASFDLYRVNPPLPRMVAALPLLALGTEVEKSWPQGGAYSRPEFWVGKRFLDRNGHRSLWLFTFARWACIPFSLIGGFACYRWAAALYGVRAGFVALSLWCFSPTVIAWSGTVMPDGPAAAAGVAAGYLFWRWLNLADWPSAFLAGISLGIAELTKLTWIVLFGLWPLAALAYHRFAATAQRPHHPRSRTLLTTQFVLIVTLAVNVINCGYGFSRSFTPLGDFPFISSTLSDTAEHAGPGNRFSRSPIGSVPVPLPFDYVLGLDVQKHDFERGHWSYLAGETKRGGWWHYYLYALAVKEPVGTIAIVCLGAGGWLVRQKPRIASDLVVLAPAIAVIVLVSSQTGFNRYLRYILPSLPYLFVWASGAALSCGRGLVAPVMVYGCVGLAALESLCVFPYSMSFFNAVAGGPSAGHKHLLDANLDWGQDLLHLKKWREAHPSDKPFHLAYFGLVDPRMAGVEYLPVPSGRMPQSNPCPAPPESWMRPGYYAISANHLYGYRHYDSDLPRYTYWRRETPIAVVGYSIYIYEVAGPPRQTRSGGSPKGP